FDLGRISRTGRSTRVGRSHQVRSIDDCKTSGKTRNFVAKLRSGWPPLVPGEFCARRYLFGLKTEWGCGSPARYFTGGAPGQSRFAPTRLRDSHSGKLSA